MDIATILSDKNGNEVFVDIEAKNQDSDEIFGKVENQLQN